MIRAATKVLVPCRQRIGGRTKRFVFLRILSAVVAFALIVGADDAGTECRVEADGTQVCGEETAPKVAPPVEHKVVIAGDKSIDAAEVEKMKAKAMNKREARRKKDALMEDIRVTAEDDTDLVAAPSSPSDESEAPKKVEEKTKGRDLSSQKSTSSSPEESEAPKMEDKATSQNGSREKHKDKGPSPRADNNGKEKDGSSGDGEKKSGSDETDAEFWSQFEKGNPQLITKKIMAKDIKVTPPPAEQKLMMNTPYEQGGLLVRNPSTDRSVILKKQRNDGNDVEREGTIKVQDDMVKYLRDVVLAEEDYADMYKKCTNKNELCAFWAYMGECYMNDDYMIRDQFCILACKKCDRHPDFKRAQTQ